MDAVNVLWGSKDPPKREITYKLKAVEGEHMPQM